jgi:hypothetical protein
MATRPPASSAAAKPSRTYWLVRKAKKIEQAKGGWRNYPSGNSSVLLSLLVN